LKSYNEIVKIRDPLEDDYRDRHEAHRKLRNFWHGRYWEDVERDSGGVSSIFRDLTARQSEVGPDIKLVYNVLKDVCVKFQSFLSPLPMIRMYVDPPLSMTRKAQSTLKERYLYGLWSANKMNKLMSDQGWYLPLMGDCFLGSFPDFEHNIVRAMVRSPEYAYPLQSFDGSGIDGVIFSWKAKTSAVKRAFPEWQPPQTNASRFGYTGRRGRAPADPEVEIIEYSDTHEFARFIDGVRVNGVEHELGYNLFEHVKFINVPGEVWGHGAVEQAVNLVEMGNAYLSLMMQSAIENVFPVMVLVDPQKAPEQIERGAGAVIPVNAGGKVEYLVPPGGNLLANAQWAQEIERMVKTDTSMPDVNFGNFQASVVTGKAINELQGAGTGSLVEMVQGIGIGAALVAWNEKAIDMGRKFFKDDTMHLYGMEAAGLADINPRHFAMKIKGSQLVGSTRNEVVFMPHLDMHSKVVMGLQLAGAGLVSRTWQREQVGIPDSQAMEEDILSEAIQDAALAALVQAMVEPGETEEQGLKLLETGHSPTPPILSVTGPNVPGAPQGAAPVPQQATAPAAPAEPSAPQGVPLDAAISALQAVQGVTGRVFLIGEIVATGVATDTVEVAVTEPADREPIGSQVPFEASFRVVEAKPSEAYVEVTPGASAVQGGTEPSPEELI
jgi:hypothetical protein